LQEIVVANVRFGDTCKSKVFLTIAKKNSSIKTIQEENETWGHWCKTNLLNQIFLVMKNVR
jgi:hypothetical protein